MGKIDQVLSKKVELDDTRKLINPADDKITKSTVKTLEEPLGIADDDVDMEIRTVGGKSAKGGR